MNHSQKLQNDAYFQMIINITNENGHYIWPDAKETYQIKNGKMIAKKSAITKLKAITTSNFHKLLISK